jgi:TrmH family RNA methyltransferase
LAKLLEKKHSILLVALDVEDPGNVGALVRTALASGAAGFIAVGVSDPHHPKAVRTSMGSLFKIPVLSYPAYGPLMEELRSAGARSFGAVSSGGIPLPEIDTAGNAVALFMGGEAFGLPEAVVSQLDTLVTVPMVSEVDSYSVNAAAAIILYELVARRNRH